MIKNKNILITGGLGFIFSHVSEYFAKNNKVCVLDSMSDGYCKGLLKKWGDNITFVAGDVIYIESFMSSFPEKLDFVIHAAAETNVDKSICQYDTFQRNNILGTIKLLEFCKFFQDVKILYVNTDEVYGSVDYPATPMQVLNPSNPYAASKAAAGHFCWAYKNTYGLSVKEIRMCNIIGKRQANTKLVPRVIESLREGKEIPVYDGGTNTREYMDVRDVAPLIESVLEHEKEEIFNLTYNQELSINEVIDKIGKVMGKVPKVKESTRKGHDKRYRMFSHKIMFTYDGSCILNKKWNFDHFLFEETIRWMVGENK